MKKNGIYIHIPFCAKKCPYCDFYSRSGTDKLYNEYSAALAERIRTSPYIGKYQADTLYFGGGTPSLLGAERIGRLIGAVKEGFAPESDFSEVTVEVNPTGEFDYALLREKGADRISIGLQSANDSELEFLGRQHTCAQSANHIEQARKAGFENISLDLMIALPGQTKEKLKRSVEFCISQGAAHISAYILKIEQGTLFYRRRNSLELPDEDRTAEMYEYLCSLMKQYGYEHYEISNFCRRGFEGKHNLKYWHDEEYIGFGPSAHSFIDGRRSYCPRSMDEFKAGTVIDDGEGGSEEEYIMLALRLSEGVQRKAYSQRFGTELPEKYLIRCAPLEKAGLIRITEEGFSLTEKGFLLSNAVIAKIIY